MNTAEKAAGMSEILAGDDMPAEGAVLRPGVALCVDLDGTLVKSDTLLDTVLVVARQRPMDLLRGPGGVKGGEGGVPPAAPKTIAAAQLRPPWDVSTRPA